VATVVREIERKYDLAAAGTAALYAVTTMAGTAGVAAVARQPEQLLDAVYYDTADLRLIRAGITFRREGCAAAPGRCPARGHRDKTAAGAGRPATRRRGHAGTIAADQEVVLAYLRDQVAAISRYDPLVRRDQPDAVHQMRVASRRARSALQAFGVIIDWDAAGSSGASSAHCPSVIVEPG